MFWLFLSTCAADTCVYSKAIPFQSLEACESTMQDMIKTKAYSSYSARYRLSYFQCAELDTVRKLGVKYEWEGAA